MSNNISFKSNIKMVDYCTYLSQIRKISPENSVNYPWTAKEIIRAKSAFTTDIKTCTAGGILTKKDDAFDVIMFHLCPPEERTPQNKNFLKIIKKISEKLNNQEPLQGFLIGSKTVIDYSAKWFDKIESFFKSLNMPYSKFKGENFFSNIHINYNSPKDTWSICSYSEGEPIHIFRNISNEFDEIDICSKDRIINFLN